MVKNKARNKIKEKKLATQKTQKKTKGAKKKDSVSPEKLSASNIAKKKKYYEAVGRRKSAVARVRLFTSSSLQSIVEGNLIINNKSYKEFFPSLELQKIIEAPLTRLKSLNRFGATIRVRGGGIKGQTEAIRHGIARALVLFDPNFRKKLKKAGYLTRDSRVKERKKFGLKKARRAPQWRKR